jgi:hypothetical protein
MRVPSALIWGSTFANGVAENTEFHDQQKNPFNIGADKGGYVDEG